MFRKKLIISFAMFVSFLLITSALKNKTRIIEKQISKLDNVILLKKKNINEAELDFHYLTSPAELEKKLNLIGLNNYQPIKHSNIFFNISDLTKIDNKISNLSSLNEKKSKKNNYKNQRSFFFEDYLETNKKNKILKQSNNLKDRIYLLFFSFFFNFNFFN